MGLVNLDQRRFDELRVMNQKQMDDIFVQTHTDFEIKRAKGCREQNITINDRALLDSVELFIEHRVPVLSLIDNI